MAVIVVVTMSVIVDVMAGRVDVIVSVNVTAAGVSVTVTAGNWTDVVSIERCISVEVTVTTGRVTGTVSVTVEISVDTSVDLTISVEVKDSVTVDTCVWVTGSGVTTTVSVILETSMDVTVDSSISVVVMVVAGSVNVSVIMSVIRLVSVWYSVKVMGATDTDTNSVVVMCSVIVSVSVVLITDGSSVKTGVDVLLLLILKVLVDDWRLLRWLKIKLKKDEKRF